MAIPAFIASGMKIDLADECAGPPELVLLGPIGGGPPTSKILNLSFVTQQQQTNWCWAATTVAVSKYYNNRSKWTECSLVNRALGRNDCCGPEGSDRSKCNRQWWLEASLKITSNFSSMDAKRLAFDDIKAEIDLDNPIGCRIGWNGGGGHFVLVVGWEIGQSGKRYLEIEDPINLKQHVPYDDFPDCYMTIGGDWTHTYFVQSDTTGGAIVGDASAVTHKDALGG